MSKEQQLRVAGTGAGYFSRFHYDAWNRSESSICVGICNKTISKAESLAKEFNIATVYSKLDTMLDEQKPDVLDIITPPATHLECVRKAAERKINIICQKPFGENAEQAEEMIAIAEQANIQLLIHENFRFQPWYRCLKQEIESGICGDVLNVQFNLRPGDGQGPDAYLERQPSFQEMEKFLVHETAIHLVDTFRYLFGEVNSIYADLRQYNPHIAGEDAGTIIFHFPNQLHAIFSGNRLLDHSSSNTRRTMGELLIEGTQGSLRLDGEANIWLRKFGEQTEETIAYPWQDQNFGGDCVFLFIEHAIRVFTQGEISETSAKDYLRNIEIENTIYQSDKEGRRIDLS